MPKRLPYLVALVVLLPGCSEPEELDAGTFQARLAGATAASLAGESSAGLVFTEETPDGQFTIRMVQAEGSVSRLIIVACSGTTAPPPGSHALDPNVEGCIGRYTRFTLEPSLEILEEVESTEGTVRLQQSSDTRTAGTFEFSGVLVRGADSLGTVQASGSFNAIAAP
jgi:hypothetical protein